MGGREWRECRFWEWPHALIFCPSGIFPPSLHLAEKRDGGAWMRPSQGVLCSQPACFLVLWSTRGRVDAQGGSATFLCAAPLTKRTLRAPHHRAAWGAPGVCCYLLCVTCCVLLALVYLLSQAPQVILIQVYKDTVCRGRCFRSNVVKLWAGAFDSAPADHASCLLCLFLRRSGAGAHREQRSEP